MAELFNPMLGIADPQAQLGAISALYAWATYDQDRDQIPEGVNLGLLRVFSKLPYTQLAGAIKVASAIAEEELHPLIVLRARAQRVWLGHCEGGWYVSDEPIH